MQKVLNVGFNNAILVDRIIGIFSLTTQNVKRIVKEEKNFGNLIDLSSNKKARSLIVTEGNVFILSAISQRTLLERLEKET